MRPPRMPLAIIVAGVMSGCGGTTSEVITSPKIEQYRIVRIAVLPFTVTPKTLGQGRGYAEPAPPPGAAEKLAELFYLKVNAREGIVVVPPRNVRKAMPALLATAVSPAQLRELGERRRGPVDRRLLRTPAADDRGHLRFPRTGGALPYG
ncbi:MAG: hypothetical protein E6K64_07635 [Nitrospirae bacterium]|nr:MAG: hypothetical protein E6K64_07635 [Nitrospirota bacterium]